MVVPALPPAPISIGGAPYVLARDPRTRAVQWSVATESASPEDLVPFRLTLPFGSWGVGSSHAALRNQFHQGTDVDPEPWSRLRPGPLQTKVGLALTYPVVEMISCRDSSGTVTASAALAANNTGIGTTAWTSPTNVYTSNDARAAISLATGATSNYLLCTTFGFAVPDDAVIVGIEVLVEGRRTSASPSVNVRIVKGGTVQTTTTDTEAAFGTSDGVLTFGSATELWSTAWTAADINSSGFGAAIYCIEDDASTGANEIDHVQIRVTYTAAYRYLYVAAGDTLTKLRLAAIGADPALGTVETKTFAHGDNAQTPIITHLVACKDGGGPDRTSTSGTAGRVIQPGDAIILVGFGNTAQIQQVNTIGVNAADTYQSLHANKAYAGQFAIAISATNTESRVWATVGATSASNWKDGAFSRLRSSAISASAKDFTNYSNWEPTTPYQAGDMGSSVNRLAEFNRGIAFSKPDGLYTFDANASAYALVPTRGFRHDDTGRVLIAWGNQLVMGTNFDLFAYPPGSPRLFTGLTRLLSNTSDLKGYPTAAVAWGDYLFASFYDGTDSRIVKFRRRDGEAVPYEWLCYPVTTVSAHKVQAMLITDDGSDAAITRLFYDCPSATADKYDVAYLTLFPESELASATGGTWESTAFGDPARRMVLEQIHAYGESLDSTNYWTPAVSWDGAAYTAIGDGTPINTSGAVTKTWTGGTADTGHLARLKLTCTRSASTNFPTLVGLSTDGFDGGGLIVEGQRQPDVVSVIRCTLAAAGSGVTQNGLGSYVREDAAEQVAALTALVSAGSTTVVNEAYWGDRTARRVVVKSVAPRVGPGEGGAPPQQYIDVVLRVLHSSP